MAAPCPSRKEKESVDQNVSRIDRILHAIRLGFEWLHRLPAAFLPRRHCVALLFRVARSQIGQMTRKKNLPDRDPFSPRIGR